MINVALFGLGRIGQMHAENLFNDKSFKLKFVYDVDYKLTQKISKKFNCAGLKNYKIAIESKVIDAARGGIINEEDLNKALNEDLIFGAGLDVFETEPPENNNPLLKNEKVFLSPHTAAFTEECMIRMGKETTQNIIDFFEKKLEKSKIVTL